MSQNNVGEIALSSIDATGLDNIDVKLKLTKMEVAFLEEDKESDKESDKDLSPCNVIISDNYSENNNITNYADEKVVSTITGDCSDNNDFSNKTTDIYDIEKALGQHVKMLEDEIVAKRHLRNKRSCFNFIKKVLFYFLLMELFFIVNYGLVVIYNKEIMSLTGLSQSSQEIKYINGTAGAAGVDGADGASGANGRDGADGANGRDGADGASGANGRDGADGRDGTDGRDGADGRDGINGTLVIFNISDYLGEIIYNVTNFVLERISNEGTLNISSINVNNIVADSVYSSLVKGHYLNSTHINSDNIQGDNIQGENIIGIDYKGNTFNHCVRGWC